jgi:hypothetical protein
MMLSDEQLEDAYVEAYRKSYTLHLPALRAVEQTVRNATLDEVAEYFIGLGDHGKPVSELVRQMKEGE